MLFKVYRATVAGVMVLGTVWAGWFFYGKFTAEPVSAPATEEATLFRADAAAWRAGDQRKKQLTGEEWVRYYVGNRKWFATPTSVREMMAGSVVKCVDGLVDHPEEQSKPKKPTLYAQGCMMALGLPKAD